MHRVSPVAFDIARSLPNPNASQSNFESTSQSLLRRVRGQDAAAWKRLVELYTPLVCYWCRRAQLSTEDTADLTQDVFRAVAGGIGNFRHENPSDTFRGWLRTVFRSKLLNFLEVKQRHQNATGGSEALKQLLQVPALEIEAEEEQQIISDLYNRAMALIQTDFEQNTWQAFWQMSVEEKSASDVATDLGMTTGAVHTARWRVLRRLRQELGDLE